MMIITDLEHREIIDPPKEEETLRQISGGFVFTFAEIGAYATGSSIAKTLVQTKVYSFEAPPTIF